MVKRDLQRVHRRLARVMDPELPFLNVVEMGMIRGVRWPEGGPLEVDLTPTYSGCPATDFIKEDVEKAMRALDPDAVVNVVLAPAWSSDDLATTAHEKMRANGIAPPTHRTADKARLAGGAAGVPCPKCRSKNTEMVSAFGSTACKAHHKCLSCLEPFDAFKCL